jgi:type IV secretory pathway VirB2 component (pilin)
MSFLSFSHEPSTQGTTIMLNNTKRSAAAVRAFFPAHLDAAQSAFATGALTARKMEARTIACFVVAGAILLLSEPAFAQTAGGASSITTFLQNLVNIITGTAGKLIAVVAIAITGIAWMIGAASARTGGAVIFGVMLVFSASWIVDQIVGG